MDAAATSIQSILFIEDEKFIADLYAAVLNNNGFSVTCAADGEQGIKLAQEGHYDLILLDIMLPGKSGIDVLKTLRDSTASPNFDQSTDIFVFTNFDEDEPTKKLIMSMAQAYYTKVTITPKKLAEILKGRSQDKSVAPALA